MFIIVVEVVVIVVVVAAVVVVVCFREKEEWGKEVKGSNRQVGGRRNEHDLFCCCCCCCCCWSTSLSKGLHDSGFVGEEESISNLSSCGGQSGVGLIYMARAVQEDTQVEAQSERLRREGVIKRAENAV